MSWPQTNWHALQVGEIVLEDATYRLSTIDCGTLKMPSGMLVCCDPFVCLRRDNNPYIQIPSGDYQVIVTLADVSDNLDGSHLREAYATLVIDPTKQEVKRAVLQQTKDGRPTGEILAEGEYFGFGVDAGTACFVDAVAMLHGMPHDDTWLEELFDNEQPDCWFRMMDDPEHICSGLANVPLPLSKTGNNLILIHSGWGDGFYPVVGGYDTDGVLVNVHIDFFVATD